MTQSYKKMIDIDLAGKRVLIREDFNVPLQSGEITDDTRIRRALPTIEKALSKNAAVILVSHFGRPTEGQVDAEFSLAPVADRLSELLQKPVRFEKNWIDGLSISPGELVLCENVRFLVGEKACDTTLSQKMAALADVFVMDAFATCHRAHASTAGIAKFIKTACAGPLLDAELTALSKALKHPEKPVLAVVGGSKVSTKIDVLQTLLDTVDVLIVGGGIANTCLAADGINVGKSLYEPDYIETAKALMQSAKAKGVIMPLPVDVAVGKQFDKTESAVIKNVGALSDDDMILDVGSQTAASYNDIMQDAKTIVWNGPVGVFEFSNFSKGTESLAKAIAKSQGFSIAGGGDTLAAIKQFKVSDHIDYISTGGGAFLEWMEGKVLPGVAALEK